MVRIRKGVEYVGTMRSKKFWTLSHDVDTDVGQVMMWQYFPAYTRPGYGSLKIDITGAEMASSEYFEYRVSGRYGNLPQNFVTTDNINDMVNTHLPYDKDQMDDAEGDEPVSYGGVSGMVGGTGGELPDKRGRDIEFMSREYVTEFPRNCYASGDDQVRFKVQANYKGHFTPPKMVDISQPSLLAIEVWMANPVVYSGADATGADDADLSTVLTGDLTSDTLYQRMVDQLSGTEVIGATQDTIESGLPAYLYHGYHDTGTGTNVFADFSGGQTRNVILWGTSSFPVDVYRPSPSNYIPAP